MRKIPFGTAIGSHRAETTMRIARSITDTKCDPYAWQEGDIPGKRKPRPFRWGPPMLNAPSGLEAELQRVLLQKQRPSIGVVLAEIFEEFVQLFRPDPPAPPIGPTGWSRITYPSDYFDTPGQAAS